MSAGPIADVHARCGEHERHGSAARGMFERIAPTYDVLNALLSAGTDRRWRRGAIDELTDVGPGPVLDLCAGTMDLAAAIAKARPLDNVVAVDFSPAMLARGRHKAPAAQVVVADASSLPFDAHSFAAVLCGFGMRNLADAKAGASEVLRVLRPGGIFVTLEFFRPERPAARAFHRAYATGVLPALGGLVSGDRGAYQYLAQSMKGFLSRREYETMLSSVGFREIAGRDMTLGVASIVRAQART
jgi:ubiquinone/menaquinone biosynthesis methyltransferase